ncbi:MAG: alpha/beta fold hydrolase, partial [Solirubrobacteraceae bacterium]
MADQVVRTGEADLCFEAFGDPGAPLVLLIMGLGLDLLWWREDFCTRLAARGFRVVRFDNRDVGRSTAFRGPGVGPWQLLTRRPHAPYALGDMADDAAGLIAALGDDAAHVVGVSLGALIAQEVALRHPDRIRSLVSIMGRPGDRRSGRVTWRGRLEFLRPPAGDPVEAMVATFRRIGSAGRTQVDDDDVRTLMRASARREQGDGTGPGRQLAAILTERDRTADLRRLALPALVVHGGRDRVIAP